MIPWQCSGLVWCSVQHRQEWTGSAPGLQLVGWIWILDCHWSASGWFLTVHLATVHVGRCPDNNRGMMWMCKYWNMATCDVTTKRSEEVTFTIIMRQICTPRHRGKKQSQCSLCGQILSLLPAADQQLFLQLALISNIHCSSSVTVATGHCTGGRREIPWLAACSSADSKAGIKLDTRQWGVVCLYCQQICSLFGIMFSSAMLWHDSVTLSRAELALQSNQHKIYCPFMHHHYMTGADCGVLTPPSSAALRDWDKVRNPRHRTLARCMTAEYLQRRRPCKQCCSHGADPGVRKTYRSLLS